MIFCNAYNNQFNVYFDNKNKMTSHTVKTFKTEYQSFEIPIENKVYTPSYLSSSVSLVKKERRNSSIYHNKKESKTSISSSLTLTSKRSKRVSFKSNFVEIINDFPLKLTISKVNMILKKKQKDKLNKCIC